VLQQKFGHIIFGLDDETMEHAVAAALVERGLTIGLAESLTGGLIAARMVDVPGASRWFRGCVVAYDTEVKHTVLGLADGPVVSEEAALAMARAAMKVLGADVGLGITGVAGPDLQEGHSPGTVFVGLALPDGREIARELRVPGDRQRVRQFAAISSLDLLRQALLDDAMVS
jgi:nicotinamide-nucleotide amidase